MCLLVTAMKISSLGVRHDRASANTELRRPRTSNTPKGIDTNRKLPGLAYVSIHVKVKRQKAKYSVKSCRSSSYSASLAAENNRTG